MNYTVNNALSFSNEVDLPEKKWRQKGCGFCAICWKLIPIATVIIFGFSYPLARLKFLPISNQEVSGPALGLYCACVDFRIYGSWMLLVVPGFSEHDNVKANISDTFPVLSKVQQDFFPCACLLMPLQTKGKYMLFNMLAFLLLIDKTKTSGELPLELFIGDFELSSISTEVILDQFSRSC